MMRDRRFVAEHRGGPLCKLNHQLLAIWAAVCGEHVLAVMWDADSDQRPFDAISLARAWAKGECLVENARRDAVAAHAAARESEYPAATAAARAAAHAASTPHMADHCLGAANYAIKAAGLGRINPELERQWQNEQLPVAIQLPVISSRARRRVYA